MTGRVVHFELPTDDAERAQAFYREAFDWTITPILELNYAIAGTTPSDENGMPTEPGAINGGMLPRQEPVTGPTITIEVDDIEHALARIEQLGGKVARGKFAVGSMGFAAYFSDSEGNLVGLWENAEPAG